MITFTFDNGVTATIRTSGTEPKIKYYTEIASKPEERYEIYCYLRELLDL